MGCSRHADIGELRAYSDDADIREPRAVDAEGADIRKLGVAPGQADLAGVLVELAGDVFRRPQAFRRTAEKDIVNPALSLALFAIDFKADVAVSRIIAGFDERLNGHPGFGADADAVAVAEVLLVGVVLIQEQQSVALGHGAEQIFSFRLSGDELVDSRHMTGAVNDLFDEGGVLADRGAFSDCPSRSTASAVRPPGDREAVVAEFFKRGVFEQIGLRLSQSQGEKQDARNEDKTPVGHRRLLD